LGARFDARLSELKKKRTQMNTQRKYDSLRSKSFAIQELSNEPRTLKNRDLKRTPTSNLAVVLKGSTVKVTAQITAENSTKLETIHRS
jgi:sRNA-binding protein